MNLAGVVNDGVVRNGTLAAAEVAYVRRDSFWIQREDRPDGEGSTAAQSTEPIFVTNPDRGVDRRALAHDGAGMAEEADVPARAWGTFSALRMLTLTAVAFALGIAVSPLVRSPRPSPPTAVIAAPTPVAAPVAPLLPAPPPAASAVNGADEAATATPTPPVARSSARTSPRNRPASALGATWSSRPSQKKAPISEAKAVAAPGTTESPDDAALPTVKPGDKPHELAPSKTKESPAPSLAPKKPAAKAWVDPWAGDVAAACAG